MAGGNINKNINPDEISVLQKGKIIFLVIVIISSFTLIGIIYAGTNALQSYKTEQLNNKKKDIKEKEQNIQKLNSLIDVLDKNKSLFKKNSDVVFYTGIDEEALINRLKLMLFKPDEEQKEEKDDKKKAVNEKNAKNNNKNSKNNQNNNKNKQKNKKKYGESSVSDNKDFANLNIEVKSASSNMVDKIRTYISNSNIVKEQNLSIEIKANVISVSITSDYEFSIYQIYGALKQYLPGYVSLLSISVMPSNEDFQDILYDLLFSNKKKIDPIDNRFTSKVEVLWFYLKR